MLFGTLNQLLAAALFEHETAGLRGDGSATLGGEEGEVELEQLRLSDVRGRCQRLRHAGLTMTPHRSATGSERLRHAPRACEMRPA